MLVEQINGIDYVTLLSGGLSGNILALYDSQYVEDNLQSITNAIFLLNDSVLNLPNTYQIGIMISFPHSMVEAPVAPSAPSAPSVSNQQAMG